MTDARIKQASTETAAKPQKFPGPRLSRHQVRVLAAKAAVDDRTAVNVLAGGRCHSTTKARVLEAAQALGFISPENDG